MADTIATTKAGARLIADVESAIRKHGAVLDHGVGRAIAQLVREGVRLIEAEARR